MDHNHSQDISVKSYVIIVMLIMVRIINKYLTNTSGHKNIVSYGNRWRFQRIIKKVLYQKYFDTLEEAIEYKLHFEKKITYLYK
jgi:hypothetical protein